MKTNSPVNIGTHDANYGNTVLPSVVVIMSAFNAEKYILEQIASILSQEDVDIQLWIRDDGSTDNTLSMLREAYGRGQGLSG